MDVLFHLNTDDTSKQSELLGNIKNLREDRTVNLDQVVVLLNADAVFMLEKGSSAEEFISKHIEQGIEFKACSNSLKNRDLASDELIYGVKSVPSGVGELAKKQEEGFIYIKP